MAQSQTNFSERTETLFSMAKDLSQEFDAHIAIIAFSPTGEPKTSTGKHNWWEVDVEALGADELPVFVRALEVLRTDVQHHLDAIILEGEDATLILFC
ncbi:hypothetical protein SETIT_3G278000v2 [Setaria italica]|uniref:MADS-box domain-containing protein n=1 Tax=Setaria italica TaxID=4555 RepID=K3ZED4_SETIT|nr:hypothetical protein SETIT_3G278000v2 [Setaria italica]